MIAITTYLAGMIAEAEAGVDFRPRTGALCPCCRRPAKIYKTQPWDGSVRIRYHRCCNAACLLSSAGTTIKSIEVDR